MNLLKPLAIASLAVLPLIPAAEAAPKRLPMVVQANASLQLASIRHNRIKLMVRVQRPANY